MNELIGDAVKIALERFREEYGADTDLEDGDEFVTCFANGTLILSFEDGNLGIKLVGGKAYQSDYMIPVFGED